MKICLTCSHGGHLTEILRLLPAFEGYDMFFITYEGERTEELERKYTLPWWGDNVYKRWRIVNKDRKKVFSSNLNLRYFIYLPRVLPRILWIFLREKPDLVVSTGSEIAIPVFLIATLFRKKRIFIETWTRVSTASTTGKLLYSLSDLFLVQWESLLNVYGPKAQFRGAVF